MKNSLLTRINEIALKVRNYAETTQIMDVKCDPFNSTPEDMWAEYKASVNEVAKLKNYLHDIDFCISLLTEACRGLSTNKPEHLNQLKQIDALMGSLKAIKRTLSDLDDGYYRVVNYYEKAGYKI